LTVNECDHITVAQFGPRAGHSRIQKGLSHSEALEV